LIYILRNNKTYYVLALLSVLAGLIALLFLGKGDLVLILNAYHAPLLDNLFLFITLLGEYVGVLGVLVVLFIWGKSYIPIYIITISFTLMVSQGLKHFVFSKEHRPYYVYQELKSVDGLERHKNNSFPSGHTSSAFAICTILAVALPQKRVQLLAALLANAVAISRVYLGQHYLNDVVVGAIIGLFVATVTIYLYSRPKPSKD
jgi:membrane-associated phospholipid phosphatase